MPFQEVVTQLGIVRFGDLSVGCFFCFSFFFVCFFLSYFVPSGVCALVVQFFKITMYLLFH